MVSQTVYFTGMVVFTLTSQIMRCTIEYQYSCQYSYEYLSTCPRVRVQVRVLLLWNSRVRVQYEYQKFSTRVLRVRVPSTSTPALPGVIYISRMSLQRSLMHPLIGSFAWFVCQFVCMICVCVCVRTFVLIITTALCLMPQSHLDVWRERVNTVWENQQHVQNRTRVPNNHRPACSKHVYDVSKTTYHRVDNVWVTFSQRFHSVCKRVLTCQTSV